MIEDEVIQYKNIYTTFYEIKNIPIMTLRKKFGVDRSKNQQFLERKTRIVGRNDGIL